MPNRPQHIIHFKTLASMRPPRVTVALAWMILFGIAVAVAIMVFVPWVQTAPGAGQVVALDPRDRVQPITALVPGRVERWYVTDGQLVKEGDPIARVVDNDPGLLERLAAERAQVLAEIAAVQQARATASIDVERSRQLLSEGLVARRDYEQAQIRVADQGAKLAESRAKLNRIDVTINRQAVQLIRAPRDGRIQSLNAAAGATLVTAGAVLAQLAPVEPKRVVELMVDGQDVALIRRGRPVRLAFEGFPAFQVSGWPTSSVGLFEGRVRSIDPSAMPDGLFRVLVEEVGRPEAAWPKVEYIRLGAKVRGWIQMETVPVGYELWRQLNDFPLEFRRPADEEAKAKAANKAEESKQ
jgi:multidrug efflux pump subunit AcrA (membrane-fusion protein)